jgi:uncharacterized protein YaiI (UPF0178 family)
LLNIYVDADACPVKEEVYRVAERYGLRVILVANSRMRTPPEDWIELVIVDDRFEAADDYIVDHLETDDIVISADIPLAARCLDSGALVLRPTGRPFTETNIGDALATRDLLAHLRDTGSLSGGPPPFKKKDRSLFLQQLDGIIQSIRKKKTGQGIPFILRC